MSKIFEALQRAEKLTPPEAPAGPEPAAATTPASRLASQAVEVEIAGLGSGLGAGLGAGLGSGLGAVTAAPQEGTPQTSVAASWAGPPAPSVDFAPRSKAVVMQDPSSLASEQYRVLRTNLLKLSETQGLKAVLITSPGPGDGKTVTALNLALTFCQKPDTRVLLIEADLRKPAISAMVALPPGRGLSDYLCEEASLDEVIRPTAVPRLHLLDSGRTVHNPVDLLHSPRMNELMETARLHFDWIVMDGPPTNPVADWDLLAGHCDGIVLVVRPFHTSRDLLRATAESLHGKKVLGAVLNAWQSVGRYGPYYGYGYGYGKSEQSKNGSRRQKKDKKEKKQQPSA